MTKGATKELAYAKKEEAAAAAEKATTGTPPPEAAAKAVGIMGAAAALGGVMDLVNGESLAETRTRVMTAAPASPLASSDAQRLAEQRRVEEANRKHLVEMMRRSSAMVREQERYSTRRATRAAERAVSRYANIMTFRGHGEGASEQGAGRGRGGEGGEPASVYEQGLEAQRRGDEKLDQYGRLLSFRGHEGKPGMKVSAGDKQILELGKQREFESARQKSLGMAQETLQGYAGLLSFKGHEGEAGLKVSEGDKQMLELGKQHEFEGAEERSRSKAAQQLAGYDVFQFHDQDVARKELARARVGHKMAAATATAGREGSAEEHNGGAGAGKVGQQAEGGGQGGEDGFHPKGEGRDAGGGGGEGPSGGGRKARLDKGQSRLMAEAAKDGFVLVPAGGAAVLGGLVAKGGAAGSKIKGAARGGGKDPSELQWNGRGIPYF